MPIFILLSINGLLFGWGEVVHSRTFFNNPQINKSSDQKIQYNKIALASTNKSSFKLPTMTGKKMNPKI